MRKRVYLLGAALTLVLSACGGNEIKVDYDSQNAETGMEQGGNAKEVSTVQTEKNLGESNERTQETPETFESEETAEMESVATDSDNLKGGGTAEKKELSLVMVGDILLHTPVENSAKCEDGSYDYTAVFAHMKDEIEAADLALVNEEVIIGGEELGVSGYPAFNAPFAIADYLSDTGFDVVLHATNHAMDKGKKGIVNCLAYWEESYPEMYVTGIYESQEDADEILLVEKNGIAVAILNYTYGTNGISLPSDMPFAVNLLEEEKVVGDIEKAKELADFVVVCPHWGTEYRLTKDSSQQKWTEIFLKNGVDLVIGTHPHVIEPIEMLYDEESNHEMLVYYSLGNFVNWTSGTGDGVSNRMVGGMAEITIGEDETGDVVILDYGVEALCTHVTSGFGGVSVYPLAEYTQTLAEENEIRSQASDFSREYAVQLCDEVWGELWR